MSTAPGRPAYVEDEYRQLFRNVVFTERVLNLRVEDWLRYGKPVGAA